MYSWVTLSFAYIAYTLVLLQRIRLCLQQLYNMGALLTNLCRRPLIIAHSFEVPYRLSTLL